MPDVDADKDHFGLPASVSVCLFDLDGVLTQTAKVHAAAWKQMFDEFLRRHAEETATPYVEFDAGADYDRYVDGKPRLDGTRDFLASRGIDLPEGDESDAPGTPSIQGLSNRKNDLVLTRIREDGVDTYPGSVDYVRKVRAAGLKTAVVSSSANTVDVPRAASSLSPSERPGRRDRSADRPSYPLRVDRRRGNGRTRREPCDQ